MQRQHMKMEVVILLKLALSAIVDSQFSALPSCDPNTGESTQCIINHMSSKFEQLSAIDRSLKYDSHAILNKMDDLGRELQSINCASSGQTGNMNRNFTCPVSVDSTVTDSTLPENCLEIYSQGNIASGVYTIYEPLPLPNLPVSKFRADYRRSMQVYCNMEDNFDGARGWTVFQRRQDGSVNFNQSWDGYRRWFGDLAGEYWLGNDNLNIITNNSKVYEMRVDLQDWEGNRRYARYSSFKVLDVNSKYQLLLGAYIAGDAGDSMEHSSNRYFSTPDEDNDDTSLNCARERFWAGWWHGNCGSAYLNNPYHSNSSTAGFFQGITWYNWHGHSYSLKFAEMKIRPVLS